MFLFGPLVFGDSPIFPCRTIIVALLRLISLPCSRLISRTIVAADFLSGWQGGRPDDTAILAVASFIAFNSIFFSQIYMASSCFFSFDRLLRLLFNELDNSDDRLRLEVELNAVEAGNNEELLFKGAIELDDNDKLFVPIALGLHSTEGGTLLGAPSRLFCIVWVARRTR